MSSCNLGSLINKHFNMLIDIFKYDLTELGVESVHTKCLYTAVTILYLICGHKAIKGSLQCYVDRVKTRMRQKSEEDKKIFIKNSMDEAYKNILNKDNRRMVYFMMITNSELPHPKDPFKEEFFPGHVFVIDKQIRKGDDKPFYRLYQSYINKYTLEEYSQQIHKPTGSVYHEYSYERMEDLMNKLKYFINSSTWDSKNVEFWKEFTLVNANNFKGYPIQPYIHFCYNALPALRCKKGLYDLLEEKVRQNKIPLIYKERVNKLLSNRMKNSNV